MKCFFQLFQKRLDLFNHARKRRLYLFDGSIHFFPEFVVCLVQIDETRRQCRDRRDNNSDRRRHRRNNARKPAQL